MWLTCSNIFISADFSSNILTISKCPALAAYINGVIPVYKKGAIFNQFTLCCVYKPHLECSRQSGCCHRNTAPGLFFHCRMQYVVQWFHPRIKNSNNLKNPINYTIAISKRFLTCYFLACSVKRKNMNNIIMTILLCFVDEYLLLYRLNISLFPCVHSL